MRRSPVQSLASSPTMVGAITTLIVIVAVFLAYNANNGLPFVPVYRVSVEIPNGARLVKNNEVRIGGHRVGVVESIEAVHVSQAPPSAEAAAGKVSQAPTTRASQDTCCVAARLNLKLDKSVAPLPEDSIFRVRYRSSFGLKYLEIVRGTGPPAPEGYVFNGLDDHGDCKLPTDLATFYASEPKTAKDGCFQPQTEFDAINDTFDTKTRTNSRTNLVGFGDAFAGRGADLNLAIGALRPVFRNLVPVSKTLADPSTELRRFIEALARTSQIVAPVATEQADFFTQAADAFAAISSDPQALRDAISEGPPTLETGIRTLPAQRAFLADLASLSRNLRPGARQLNLALPDLNGAVRIGTPVLLKTPAMNERLRQVFVALHRIAADPETGITLGRLKETFDSAKPLAGYVAPIQTVCNYWNYWFTYLTEHITERDQIGYQQRIALVGGTAGPTEGNFVQGPLNGYSGIQANGRTNATIGDPVQSLAPDVFAPHQIPILHGDPYGPLGQPQFNGPGGTPDCQSGQTGYLLGRYPVPNQAADNPAVGVSDLPGVRGVTDLYLNQDGTRTLKDTRIPSHQP